MSIRNETINRLSLPSPLHLSHYFPIVQPFPVKLLFPSHHLVYVAVLRMPAFQSRPQQHRAELHGIAATHQGGMRFLQLVKDVGGSQVDALLCRKRGTEQAANRLLGKADTIESLVVPLQFLLLRLGEPAAPSGNEFRFQLGENPVVLYAGAVDVVLHLDAEETPAPRGVGQQVEAVAGADERGDTG